MTDNTPTTTGTDNQETTFTQEQVNQIVAKRLEKQKRSLDNQETTFTQEQVDKLIADRLEEYKRSQEEDEQGQSHNREARYRIRAKEAEAERDTLRENLTQTRRSMLKTQDARLDGRAASDLFDGMDEQQVNELFQEDGTVDNGKLSKLVDDLLAKKPYMRRNIGVRNQTGVPTHQRRSSGWADSF